MTEGVLGNKRTSWALAALMLVLFSITNLPWHLDDYDQAKQAWTSYEMVTEGHWFYQRTSDDQGLATKPPLTGWISAAIFTITRSWDVAWRLPSLLCAALIALMLFRSASRAYGNIAGLIAFAAFGLLTAGMLIKGPVVYAFLLPGIVVYQLCKSKTGGASAWCGWWPWLGSLAIFLIWAIAGCLWVPRFYDLVVLDEFVARFGAVGTHAHSSKSVFFYLPHLLHKFFPWSAVLIGL